MAYPRDLVARMKGALRVLKPKELSYISGIPAETLKSWATDRREDVPADESVVQDVRNALMGDFLRSSTR